MIIHLHLSEITLMLGDHHHHLSHPTLHPASHSYANHARHSECHQLDCLMLQFDFEEYLRIVDYCIYSLEANSSCQSLDLFGLALFPF